ncbi:FadR/GntR family transcriptional regulator [Neobacillus mesonae]|uniref:FadR/GntR family transcriptional regulator n=1 Tax=Neobacillus mesonae TaxID=1193713 RepID=UPI00203EC1B4|nr:FadR/GntR family transcriptional regulator [Neobacillus mesonae]MCM3567596.1 FadR family transcriptional regulator [Neobacillus mesonae]
MFNASNFKRATVAEKVVDYIKELIVKEKISPKEKLPSEREMSEKLNISRNTVREAYKILSTLGYVEIKHGLGVFVSSETKSINQWAASFFMKSDQILELFDIRMLLESQSVKWASEFATKSQINTLQEHVQHSFKLFKNMDIKQSAPLLAKADQEFHILLAEFSGNSILHRIMLNLIDMLNEIHKETIEIPGRLYKSIQEHEKIVESVKKKEIDSAEKEMLRHLESVREDIIININKERKNTL